MISKVNKKYPKSIHYLFEGIFKPFIKPNKLYGKNLPVVGVITDQRGILRGWACGFAGCAAWVGFTVWLDMPRSGQIR
ncbi:MAG: hypothetical protein ORN54_02545 [Cyclobacteriaceae bacterium]|nr:hypothetical protein [Cyclobacteriaceae bacterium]